MLTQFAARNHKRYDTTMADEKVKPEPAKADPAAGQLADQNSKAPADAKATAGAPPAEALADGTVPTVLSAGNGHRSVAKGKASLTGIYRRADIMTTVLTTGGVILALAAILGGYYWFAVRPAANKPATTTTTTELSTEELKKLGSFFEGNSAGGNAQTLTISPSTLFSSRVAISQDLKVIGGLEVSGDTTLAGLTANKTSNLGITNIRGQLTVAGPMSVQSPVTLAAGATVTGNLTTTGTGSFGGVVSAPTVNATTVTVSGTLNIGGHVSISGQTPSATPAGQAGAGASASVEGIDSAGTVTIRTGTGATAGLLVNVTFKSAYPRAPHIVITPIGSGSAALQPYIIKTATGFTIGAVNAPSINNTSYSFEFWVVQ